MTEQEFQAKLREIALNPELMEEAYDKAVNAVIKEYAESNLDRRIN